MNIEQINKKIEELENMKKELLVKKEEEKNKQILIKIPELNIEVERNLHEDMQYVKYIKIPEGFRLLELSELLFIYNNYQNKFNWGKDEFFDEITKQPIKNCKFLHLNVWFDVCGSGFYGINRSLVFNNAVRGVRFCREIK